MKLRIACGRGVRMKLDNASRVTGQSISGSIWQHCSRAGTGKEARAQAESIDASGATNLDSDKRCWEHWQPETSYPIRSSRGAVVGKVLAATPACYTLWRYGRINRLEVRGWASGGSRRKVQCLHEHSCSQSHSSGRTKYLTLAA